MSPTPADWSHQDETMTTMEPSSDLFDGDILGDELIDIYNAAVVGGGDDDDDAMNEIPTLLAPATDLKDVSISHPGETVATTAATIDDGLGAFRPSTSFNDLSSLQPPEEILSSPGFPARAKIGAACPGARICDGIGHDKRYGSESNQGIIGNNSFSREKSFKIIFPKKVRER